MADDVPKGVEQEVNEEINDHALQKYTAICERIMSFAPEVKAAIALYRRDAGWATWTLTLSVGDEVWERGPIDSHCVSVALDAVEQTLGMLWLHMQDAPGEAKEEGAES
jgi:hypothetical protein